VGARAKKFDKNFNVTSQDNLVGILVLRFLPKSEMSSDKMSKFRSTYSTYPGTTLLTPNTCGGHLTPPWGKMSVRAK
jgi:hypothetical protein